MPQRVKPFTRWGGNTLSASMSGSGAVSASPPPTWNLPATISVFQSDSVGVRQYATDSTGWTITVTGLATGLTYDSVNEEIDGAATGTASGTATFTLSKSGETDVVDTTTVALVELGAWQLPSTNFVSAKMPMEVVHPRSFPVADGGDETPFWARHKKAYPGIEYRIPISILGGAYPFYYEILEGPAWLSIGQQYGQADYGILKGTPPAVAAAATVRVRITDQELTQKVVEFPITVTDSTNDFIFIDSSVETSGDGSFASPLKYLWELYQSPAGPRLTTGAYPYRAVYLKPGAYEVAQYYWPNEGTHSLGDTTNFSRVWLGIPGQAKPVIDFTNAKLTGIVEPFFAGLSFQNTPQTVYTASRDTAGQPNSLGIAGDRGTFFENDFSGSQGCWLTFQPYLDAGYQYVSASRFKVNGVNARLAFRHRSPSFSSKPNVLRTYAATGEQPNGTGHYWQGEVADVWVTDAGVLYDVPVYSPTATYSIGNQVIRDAIDASEIYEALQPMSSPVPALDDTAYWSLVTPVYHGAYFDGVDTHVFLNGNGVPTDISNVRVVFRGGATGFIYGTAINNGPHRKHWTFWGNTFSNAVDEGVPNAGGGYATYYSMGWTVHEANTYTNDPSYQGGLNHQKASSVWMSWRRNLIVHYGDKNNWRDEGYTTGSDLDPDVFATRPEDGWPKEFCYNTVMRLPTDESAWALKENASRDEEGRQNVFIYRNTIVGQTLHTNRLSNFYIDGNLYFTSRTRWPTMDPLLYGSQTIVNDEGGTYAAWTTYLNSDGTLKPAYYPAYLGTHGAEISAGV